MDPLLYGCAADLKDGEDTACYPAGGQGGQLLVLQGHLQQVPAHVLAPVLLTTHLHSGLQNTKGLEAKKQ